jgi:hypothetical protein
MSARRGVVSELCFAAEGMAGTAAAASLRRLSSLVDAAPAGRLFAAITTLTDMSSKATRALEDGHAAMQAHDNHHAAVKFARAIAQMDDLAATASGETQASEPPGYLRKQR